MPELVTPTVRLHRAWLEAHEEWGPCLHEDGFGLEADDDVESAAGFAVWVTRLAEQADPARATAMGSVTCTYRWVVEGSRVQGGIALRPGPDERVRRIGHLGYGIRPSARGRGLASWALGQMLQEAGAAGLDRVLLVCEDDNLASARTIERVGGVLESVVETDDGSFSRYWVTL